MFAATDSCISPPDGAGPRAAAPCPPDRLARAGDPDRPAVDSISPASRGSAPKIIRTTSVRPEPTRPASPRISPGPGRRRRRARTGATGRGREASAGRRSPAPGPGTSRRGAADDLLHHPALVELARRDRGDHARVLHHRDPVGELQHLVEAVRHVDDRHAVARSLRSRRASASTSFSVSETVGSSMISSWPCGPARGRSSPAAARPATASPRAAGGRRSGSIARRLPRRRLTSRQRTRPPVDG